MAQLIDLSVYLLVLVAKPILILLVVASLINVLRSRLHKKSAEWINLWILLGTLSFIGLQTILSHEALMLSKQANVGISIDTVSFLREDGVFKQVINEDGKIPSMVLNIALSLKNYGNNPALVKQISLELSSAEEVLKITDPKWKALPLFPGQPMTLNLTRPISVNDFDRLGEGKKKVIVQAQLTYSDLNDSWDSGRSIRLAYSVDLGASINPQLIDGGFEGARSFLPTKLWQGISKIKTHMVLAGLVLEIIGVIFLIGKPVRKYVGAYILRNSRLRKEIEDEAIAVSFNRLASDNRTKNLQDSIARGFITTYKSSFIGFLFIFSGFLLQSLGLFLS